MSLITGDDRTDSARLRLVQPKSYTLAEIEVLTREYVTKVSEPESMVDWRMSDFIAWLRKREREGK